MAPGEFGPEWSLLELLCHSEVAGDRPDGSTLDFDLLVDHATRHQILPLLAYFLTTECDRNQVPAQLASELADVLTANHERVDTLTAAAVDTVAHLRANGITVVATKGVVFAPTIYGGRGTRKMNDADLMIHPESRAAVVDTMTGLGYRNGVYDPGQHIIRDLPATTKALYRLSPSHLPHFMRLGSRRTGIVAIDFANSVTWAGSEWQVPMSEVLARTDEVKVRDGTAALPTLVPNWLFLFTTMHLFRESWFWRETRGTRDSLHQYADVIRLWQRHREVLVAELPDLIDRHGLVMPIGWVLEHTDRTFDTSMMAELGLAGSMPESWLASCRGPGGMDLTWSGTMRARLHLDDTATLLSVPS